MVAGLWKLYLRVPGGHGVRSRTLAWRLRSCDNPTPRAADRITVTNFGGSVGAALPGQG